MISKSWFCVLLTAVVLICGCSETAKETNTERKIMISETNLVKLQTSMGNIVLELDAQAAPVTVKNFLEYIDEGFYDRTIFHRVIPGFMIQGGGLTTDMERKQTRDPIVNEANNGLGNERGTIAMARSGEPDSATCQFFINHTNNMPLNYVNAGKPGYAVFGKVIEGMDTVDAIASVKTTTRVNKEGRNMGNVPVNPIVIKSAKVHTK
ncbi:MAG: peptidyl-prolyl cis-trans isomerase [Planctomycetes bacterium]|nr:peptidyl-prolyl cis-trans isomerase [Planctomycetota bacterium]